MKNIYRKLTEAGLDHKDLELLSILAEEQKFTDEDYQRIGQKAGLDLEETKNRLNALREKKILLKDRQSILDQVKIWDGYYMVFVKAAIQPPVIGIDTKFPVGWVINDYLQGLKQVEKEMDINLIRHAYILQGIEWDMLLIISAKSQDEYVEYFNRLAKQGWISKAWSFMPVEANEEWIFDPIASPNPEKVKSVTQELLTDE